jgi:hypothetical protein
VNRRQLEHVIRAAASIADDPDIAIFGSQAILASHPDAPAAMLRSTEADVWPMNHPERWEVIDGAIGEGSPFHETFGYYAQGIEERTAVLPRGWRPRLVLLCNENTRQARGWALEPHDLVVAKLIAGRDKDLAFAAVAMAAELVRAATLLTRLAETAVDPARRELVAQRVRRMAGIGSVV